MKKKKRKARQPLFDIEQAASCTECTGLLPAQVQTNEEGEAVAQLMNIFPVVPPDAQGPARPPDPRQGGWG